MNGNSRSGYRAHGNAEDKYWFPMLDWEVCNRNESCATDSVQFAKNIPMYSMRTTDGALVRNGGGRLCKTPPSTFAKDGFCPEIKP